MGQLLAMAEPAERMTGVTRRSYLKGQVIFSSGEICDRVYYVSRGVVKLSFVREDGTEKIVTHLGPGSILGESGVFCGKPESVTATAAWPVDIIVLTRSDLDRLVGTDPDFSLQLMSSLSRKIDLITSELECTCLRSAGGRIAYALHQLGISYGIDLSEGRMIEYRVTHEELARMAGTCRVTVTNVLAGLRRQGIIDQRRAAIVIKDRERLISWAT